MAHVNLGDQVRDSLTGIEGVAYGRSTYLTGCDHIGIKRTGTGSDGKPYDLHWVDEPLLVVLQPSAFSVPHQSSEKPGGPSLHRHSR